MKPKPTTAAFKQNGGFSAAEADAGEAESHVTQMRSLYAGWRGPQPTEATLLCRFQSLCLAKAGLQLDLRGGRHER